MTKLIILAFILAGIIYTIAYQAGKKTLQRDYDQDYKSLENLVYHSRVNKPNCREIRRRFSIIDLYGCRNKEKLDVLYRQFKSRFQPVMPKPKNNAA